MGKIPILGGTNPFAHVSIAYLPFVVQFDSTSGLRKILA
jgi:hypothetical protein